MADNPYSECYDNQEIEVINTLFQQQKIAHNKILYPSASERISDIIRLKKALIARERKFIEAMKIDFGHRSEDDAKFGDILTTVMSANNAIKRLKRWMKPSKRHVSVLFQPAKAQVQYQPLGVIGIITPWNYPIFLALGPLITALSAGNHAIIKMSEFTPATNEQMSKLIAEVFPPEQVTVVNGGAKVAAHFSSIPFDHIVFTGSSAVGRKVMTAAAQNLTPVTLKLGGKSPVIIDPDIDINVAVERFIMAKTINSGQTCVAPDYILCPEEKITELCAVLKTRFHEMYAHVGSNPDYSGIINDAQFSRLQNLMADAQAKGAQVTPLLEESADELARKIPLTLLTNVNDDMTIMQQEIFGPLLPILPYKTFNDAINYINMRPKPLALYLMSFDLQRQQQVLKYTKAGGVCINDAAFHAAQDDLPFGGVGESGMGHYHGKEGFLALSKAKPIFSRGRFSLGSIIFPPYNKYIHQLIYKFFIK